MSNLSNVTIDIENNKCLIKINPKIYRLEIIYSAAYAFLERAYVLIDGDPETEIIVEIKPKNKKEINIIGNEFDNELLNYATYDYYSKKNQEIRDMIVKRALATNIFSYEFNSTPNKSESTADTDKEDMINDEDYDWENDPESIAIPWEEKYGKNKT